MIIIKGVPGLTERETLEVLMDIARQLNRPVKTAYGGFAVDEEVAERFLLSYLIAAGRRSALVTAAETISKPAGPARPVTAPEPVADPEPVPAPESDGQAPKPVAEPEPAPAPAVRRSGTRKRGGAR